MERQKRVLAIHDISGVGKCSLTVALPIISAAGVECSVLPTAVLSTHTGGFTAFTCRDLTADIAPIVEHWKSLHLKFDAIYTGYLGSFEQINLMKMVFDELADEDTLIAVDPVMGDNGRLYAKFDMTFPPSMRELCAKADLIMPNFTEATLMLGEPYHPAPYTREYVEGLLKRLSSVIPTTKHIVLTGVSFDELELGAAAYDVKSGTCDYILGENVPGSFHGTGDVFGSALVGAMAAGKTLSESVRIAVDFTAMSIEWTSKAGTDIRYGVNFEAHLGNYIEMIKN
ncbi:MAG: pyridoxamine kinase [Selenomonadaceae bacterium]